MASNALLTTGTIATSGTALPIAIDTRTCDVLAISAPATLPETVNIVAPDGSVLQSPPGTDIVIAAGKTVVFLQWPFNSVQLLAGTTAGARMFTFYGQRNQSGT